MKIKKEYLILALIVVAGLIVKIPLLIKMTYVGVDSVKIIRLTKNLFESGNYIFGENFNWGIWIPPGYPLSIGVLNIVVNDYFISAKLISLISSILTSLLFYNIGRELYSREAGLFAAFAFTFHPLIVRLSYLGLSEPLFFCLVSLAVYLSILLLRKNSFLHYILLGLVIALSFLTRPEGLFLLLLPFLLLLNNTPFKRKERFFKISISLLIFILTISPYMIFLRNATGKLTLTGKANASIMLGELSGDRDYHEVMNIPENTFDREAFLLNEKKTQLKGFDKDNQRTVFNYIFKDPISFMGKYQKKLLREVKALIKLIFPIMLLLFFVFFKRDLFEKKIRLHLLIFPLLFFAIYPVFVIVDRHILIIVLFLILFSSGGFDSAPTAFYGLVEFYSLSRNRIISFLEKNIKYVIVLIFILSSISIFVFTSLGKMPLPFEHVRAGKFLKENVSSEYEKLNVMSRKYDVSYHSGARHTMLPYASGVDVLNFAKLYDVDYIVVDERYLGKWDFYDELIKLDKYSDEVELAYEDSSEKLIRMFKVKKQ